MGPALLHTIYVALPRGNQFFVYERALGDSPRGPLPQSDTVFKEREASRRQRRQSCRPKDRGVRQATHAGRRPKGVSFGAAIYLPALIVKDQLGVWDLPRTRSPSPPGSSPLRAGTAAACSSARACHRTGRRGGLIRHHVGSAPPLSRPTMPRRPERTGAPAVLLAAGAACVLFLVSLGGSAHGHGIMVTSRQRGALNTRMNFPTIDGSAPIDDWYVWRWLVGR